MIKIDYNQTIYDIPDIEYMTSFKVISKLRYNWWLCFDQASTYDTHLLLVKPIENHDYIMVDLKDGISAYVVINNEIKQLKNFKEIETLMFERGVY